MKLFNCYHPKVVTNRYTGEKVVTRCGKCPACLDARSASWVQRLDEEMLHFKYTFFATLQFDEQHVPQLSLLDKEDRPSNMPAYINVSTGQVFDLADVSDVTQADINYCENTKFLLVHDVKVVQDFIKRLRKLCYEQYDSKLRYYIALEIGPTTHRPHCHSLFFFNSPLLAKDFGECLRKTWRNGDVYDPHPVSGSASQYVASYLNSFASLPKIYLHKDLRQKALASKCPPIGITTWTEETFRRFFDSDARTITIFRKSVSKFDNVPVWRSILDRIYPKIVAFSRLSHQDRVVLYGLGFRFIEQDPLAFSGLRPLSSRELSQNNLIYLSWFLSRPYWSFYLDLFKSKQPFSDYQSRGYDLNDDSLKRFISVVSRVCRNCLAWNVSVSDYVLKIERFYENLEIENLRDWYHLQDDYFVTHPKKDFLSLNPNFCLSVCGRKPSQLEDWQRYYLEFYAPELLVSEKPIFIKYSNSSAYQSMVGLHNKIYSDNTKQKRANDYLLAHKDKFNNIITYNNEIENYVKKQVI